MTTAFDLPFEGAISRYFAESAPADIRAAVKEGKKRDILSDDYPYKVWMGKDEFQNQMKPLQIELVKLQSHIRASGQRLCLVFEGRDAAGKGGAISWLTQNLNPRYATVVALPKPSDREATQWYFQRYVDWLPAAGEMTIFDRSWYNRGVVEPVFEFCTEDQRAAFFRQLPSFEASLVDEGIVLVKFWLDVGRAEQLRRLLARESDPLKHWKLSWIDVEGLNRWDAFSRAIQETLAKSHSVVAPWTFVRADDKYRARLAVVRHVLAQIDYAHKEVSEVSANDSAICQAALQG
ncbi:polyphosphate kinase 2 [Limnohabitans sp.]|jgi:polyphosphate kinase 2|uniref:polyphosphate kinase 2 n=1 Tax=Limnohabitans sp. TaxID=1907725 RepID=UPI0037BE70EE